MLAKFNEEIQDMQSQRKIDKQKADELRLNLTKHHENQRKILIEKYEADKKAAAEKVSQDRKELKESHAATCRQLRERSEKEQKDSSVKFRAEINRIKDDMQV